MKTLYKLLAIALLAVCCILNPHKASASHFAAWDMSYRALGGDTFRVTLNVYYDCSGIPASTSESICVKSAAGQSFTVPLVGFNMGFVTPTCVADTNTACNSPFGINIGFKVWRYEGDVFLGHSLNNPAANQWTFSWTNSARNGAIQNLMNPSSTYTEAYLDNNILPANNSPVFYEKPVPYRCVGKPVVIQQGVGDIDGDSLVFSLVAARAGNTGCPLTATNYAYNPPYSATYPHPCTVPPILSQVNGDIYVTASLPSQATQFVAIYSINCKEYRQSVKIGEVNRDLQVIFKSALYCDTTPLTLGQIALPNVVDTVNSTCMDSILTFRTSIPFICSTLAPDGSDFRMIEASTGQYLPIDSAYGLFCNPNTSTQQIFINLHHRIAQNGVYYIVSKMGNDNNTLRTVCGINMREFDTVAVITYNCAAFYQPQPIVCASVDSSGTAIELNWLTGTPAIDPVDFKAWKVFRRTPTGNWEKVFASGLYAKHNFTHSTQSTLQVVSPSSQSSQYAVTLETKSGFLLPLSMPVAQMYLRTYGPVAPQADTMPLVWNANTAWPNPIYELQYAEANAPNIWMTYATGIDTLATFIKPISGHEYEVRIATRPLPGSPLPPFHRIFQPFGHGSTARHCWHQSPGSAHNPLSAHA